MLKNLFNPNISPYPSELQEFMEDEQNCTEQNLNSKPNRKNMNTDQLRGLILSNLKEVKSVMLSPQSVEIVKWLKESHMTSVNLAERLDININNASNRLKKLYKQGYLDRVVDRSSSGGVEYRYRTKKEFFEFL